MLTRHDIIAGLSALRHRTRNKHLFNEGEIEKILTRYSGWQIKELSYATVRDFCDSADNLPQIAQPVGTLKDVQRPWIIKALLGTVPFGAKLLEIGGGDPFVSDALYRLGYDVTIIDPYDGTGNGPQAYLYYTKAYPKVRIIRAYFQDGCPQLKGDEFDCIFSVSVLEHIHHEKIRDIFAGVSTYLKTGGYSIHCVDHVIKGMAEKHNQKGINEILTGQYKLQNPNLLETQIQSKVQSTMRDYLDKIETDIDTFYNSPLGHNLWRKALKYSYDEYPYRKIASLQTCVVKS